MLSGPVARRLLSRRQTLAGLSASWALKPALAGAGAPGTDGPIFSVSGPDADCYGAAEGFPVRWQINDPDEARYRVGNFSHFDSILPTRKIARAATAWHFDRSSKEILYSHRGARYSIGDYVARNPVTGLLVAKGDQILYEHYQYGRSDRDRLASRSMAKTITGLLIGIAVSEGAIRSVDDPAETYVPEFKGTEY